MRTSSIVLWLATVCAGSATHVKRNYDQHDYYALHLRPDIQPQDVADHIGLTLDGPLGHLTDHYMFHSDSKQNGYDVVQTQITDLKSKRRKREIDDRPHILDNILLTQKQELHKRFPLVKREATPQHNAPGKPVEGMALHGEEIAKQLDIHDPIYSEQWHLFNMIQPGHDINVTGVWLQGITGKNSTVCIVDDGLDMDSDDLRDNYFAAGSYDFNDDVDDPKPRLSDDRHGTRCAGEVAAVRNNVCGVGVAYDSRIAGERILSKVISDADEAVAMTYAYQENDIYSCSWGPPDDGMSMESPNLLIKRAMLAGVQKGRGGLGSIYVFAIGNGAANDDNCNFDGYTNSIYSVSVGGIDRNGLHPYYSEACSAQLVVTYSSGSGDAIHTTDVGKDTCYAGHGGTSAAGPLVAGIYALMLEVNRNLNWRDLQWITVLTAVKIDQHSDWYLNEAVQKDFSHQFGYGKADAYAMVEMAKTWKSVKPQAWFFSPWQHVKQPIPQGDQGLASRFDVTAAMLKEANLDRLEHVTVTMNVEHQRRGDLSVELHSPSGMVSHIATHRRNDNARVGYVDWTFMSVAHWGESGIGTWTVIVKDTLVNDNSGNFTDYKLRLWGECIDPTSQPLLPQPQESDDDDHDREDAVFHTTSVALPTMTGAPAGNPSDHIDRPVNNKISETGTTAQTTDKMLPVETIQQTTTAVPTPVEDEKVEETQLASSTPSATPSTAANFLPHPFPSFGVSKTTQIWIYGAFVLIVLFLLGLGAYVWYIRRKKAWMSRDDYGFEMVESEDRDEASGQADGGYGKGRKKRAGELYDAFAKGSEEDLGLVSDSEDEDDHAKGSSTADRYHDRETTREGLNVR